MALCLAFSFITLSSNSQTTDSTTGNLINYSGSPTDTTSTWNNGVYVNTLCFQYGQPGNCGPNPSIREGNYINFSYGTVDLNQVVNINRALAISGGTVQLSGFNFGFTAKNGNGWDDARQDYLAAYVKLYGSSGNQVANYDYSSQTNQRYNWTQFNFSEKFATPYTASTLSNAQVGFVGRDNNFWAGNYGPEIYNVNFNLTYSVKPAPAPVVPAPPTYTAPAPAPMGPALAGPDPTNPAPSPVGPQGPQGPVGPVGPAPGPQGQDPNQNPSIAQDNPAQPSPQQAGPAPTSPQPAGGPPQATQTASTPLPSAGPQSAGPQQGGGAGPSKLAMSVVKSAQDKDKATQAQAVQNAAKALEGTQQSAQAASNAAVSMNQDMSATSATAAAQFSSQATQASQQVATQASQGSQQTTQASAQTQQATRAGPQVQQQQQEVEQAQTQTSSLAPVQAPQQQDTQQAQSQTSTSVVKLLPPPQQEQPQSSSQLTAGQMPTLPSMYVQSAQPQQDAQSTQVAILKAPSPMVIETQQQSSTGTGLTVSRNLFAYNPLLPSNTSNMSVPLPASQPTYQPRVDTRSNEVEILQTQVAGFGSRAGSPLSEIIMQQQFEMMQASIVQPNSSVNKNALPNELAGGVDIASMASVPTGFNAYSFVLRDSAFYEPKEVYKNQRTIDNARVLRGLTSGSDAKHQEMVNQQYKLGN